ncbi:Mitochondrial ribosome subunit S26 [Gracilaria domingensis]|nr:Mitochondrial ribosome subunit S26 [Gracilaria domingensis]
MNRVASGCIGNTAFATRLALRTLCTDKAPRAPRPRGVTEFVKRRREYKDEVHLLRIRFAGDSRAEQEGAQAQSSAQVTDESEQKNEREARKREFDDVAWLGLWDRERSLQRLKEHKERLRQVQEVKKERVAFRRNAWEKRQTELVESREAVVQLLLKEAPNWITDDSLDKHVEQAVDEFFIEGVADARRDEEALRMNGDVRGAMAA